MVESGIGIQLDILIWYIPDMDTGTMEQLPLRWAVFPCACVCKHLAARLSTSRWSALAVRKIGPAVAVLRKAGPTQGLKDSLALPISYQRLECVGVDCSHLGRIEACPCASEGVQRQWGFQSLRSLSLRLSRLELREGRQWSTRLAIGRCVQNTTHAP